MSPASVRGPSGVSRRDFLKAGLGALAAPALSGCLRPLEPKPIPVSSYRFTARPGIPTASPTLGLSRLGLAGSRDGLIYVPQGYSADVPAPLVVALHGAGGSSDDWTAYADLAESRGMILVAPDSRGVTWDVVEPTLAADVAFVDRALAVTFERCRVNPGRIALAGFSDGASAALSLGLINGALFSHVVAYSPGMIVLRNTPEGKPLIFISHGTLDTIIAESISEEQIVPYLRGGGYNVVFQPFEGGHEVPLAIANASLDWFFGDAPPLPPLPDLR